MSKSLKLKNDEYIDTTGIMHNRRLLSSLLEKETIYDKNGIVLEKIGNIMHYYTNGYVSKGQPEGYTIPAEYRPAKNMKTTCAVYSAGTYWHACSFSLSNKQVWIPEKPEGGLLTDYIYIGFSVFWFI